MHEVDSEVLVWVTSLHGNPCGWLSVRQICAHEWPGQSCQVTCWPHWEGGYKAGIAVASSWLPVTMAWAKSTNDLILGRRLAEGFLCTCLFTYFYSRWKNHLRKKNQFKERLKNRSEYFAWEGFGDNFGEESRVFVELLNFAFGFLVAMRKHNYLCSYYFLMKQCYFLAFNNEEILVLRFLIQLFPFSDSTIATSDTH